MNRTTIDEKKMNSLLAVVELLEIRHQNASAASAWKSNTTRISIDYVEFEAVLYSIVGCRTVRKQ